MRLGDAGGDGADADLGHQLDADARVVVAVLQIVDQLRQILDGINVVVRRRRDQADARRRMADLGDPRINLVAGQLAALAGLGALRHLDLQFPRVDQIFARHAEAAGRHLLDGAVARIAVGIEDVAGRIFAALAGVALAADAVHGDGQRLVRFLADRAIRHRPRLETLHDRLDRLNLLERNRLLGELQLEQTAQRTQTLRLIVDQFAVFLEHLVIVAADGVLQLVDRLRIEQVILAFLAPLILAARVEDVAIERPLREGAVVPRLDLGGDHVQTDAGDARRRPGEILVDDLLAQADRLEDLCAAIALRRGNAHLGHDLHDALADRLDVVLDRLVVIDAGQFALTYHVVERLEGQVRIDGAGAVADEQGEVMHLARLAALEDQADLGARALADQVMMHPGDGEQGRDRRHRPRMAAIAEDDEIVAGSDHLAGVTAQGVHRLFQSLFALVDGEQDRQRDRFEIARTLAVQLPQLVQLVVFEDRRFQLDLPGGARRRFEQVVLGADGRLHRHDEFFADAIHRRIRHLREQLLEVVVEAAADDPRERPMPRRCPSSRWPRCRPEPSAP